jgi:hypothetical protein
MRPTAYPLKLADASVTSRAAHHNTAENAALPTAREVGPWVAVIEKLWDDHAFEAAHREGAKAEARRWSPTVVQEQYAALFERIASHPSTRS